MGLSGQFETWAGTLLDQKRPLVIVAAPGREEEAIVRLGRIGFESVRGYLEGGMEAISGREDLLGRFDRLAPATLVEWLGETAPPVVLDVRNPGEVEAGAIPGSLPVPLSELSGRLAVLPRDQALVVHCAGGYRSAIAASLLLAAGFERVSDLAGGYAAWQVVAEPSA